LSPLASSEALKSGYFLSAATTALMRNASIVSLMPAFSFSLLSCTRSASSSVTSASSNCVTCGIIAQLRARFAPEIFLMRDSGLTSTSPNLAKSTFGHGSRLSPPPPPDAARGTTGERGLDEILHVFLADAALALAALDLREIDAEFARERAHGRARVRHLVGHDRARVEGDWRRARRHGTFRFRGRRRRRRFDFRGRRRRSGGSGSRGGRRSGLRRRCGFGGADFDDRDDLPFRNLVANLHRDRLHDTIDGRRHFHRRLVRFERDQALILADALARLDQHLDHRDVGVVADVGNLDFLRIGRLRLRCGGLVGFVILSRPSRARPIPRGPTLVSMQADRHVRPRVSSC
jgi:hypothetical protein